MTSISSVSSSAWSGMGMQRSQRAAPSPERLMSKIDTDQSGGVNDTELAEAVKSLREENRLTYAEDDATLREPRVVCSMGLIRKQ